MIGNKKNGADVAPSPICFPQFNIWRRLFTHLNPWKCQKWPQKHSACSPSTLRFLQKKEQQSKVAHKTYFFSGASPLWSPSEKKKCFSRFGQFWKCVSSSQVHNNLYFFPYPLTVYDQTEDSFKIPKSNLFWPQTVWGFEAKFGQRQSDL